jgi:hypothetical protein
MSSLVRVRWGGRWGVGRQSSLALDVHVVGVPQPVVVVIVVDQVGIGRKGLVSGSSGESGWHDTFVLICLDEVVQTSRAAKWNGQGCFA